AEELADLIVALSQPADRILLYRAAAARDVLPDRLIAAGRIVESVAAYKTAFTNDPMFARQVESADILTFTSASTVAGFVHNLGGNDPARAAVTGKTIGCIGPITAQAAKDAGLHVDIVADEYTANGLIAALLRTYSSATR
ncbi:MAG TPA: uroporphyrinogen-III synthase, partial [Candidatus Rubrimentiphilum sp.]|nr:uroporphyrinogen-III synthase [Candidatus Rubrimentiphilum sp.]